VTRTELAAWLDTRRPAPPPALRQHLMEFVQDAPGNLAQHLADAGVALLGRVLSRPEGGRELALDLLAADALVTYAFEAQAEFDIGGLTGLARRIAEATA
jgi:hypothetical protein